jgi:hypothetical protein
MSEERFTRRPTSAERVNGTSGQYLITDGVKHLALVQHRGDALLYSAAPDMHAALQSALCDDPDWRRLAVAALDKAEGRVK